MLLDRLYDLALWPHPWPWPWSFKVRVWNIFFLRNGVADWHETKRIWVIHSWPWYRLVWPWCGGRMYQIVTGVTSDVGVPSAYLVEIWLRTKFARAIWYLSGDSLIAASLSLSNINNLCLGQVIWNPVNVITCAQCNGSNVITIECNYICPLRA